MSGNFAYPMPVSYTHLDVYKRQVLVNLDLIDEYLEAFRDEEF